MSNQLKHGISAWYESRAQQNWALGVIYQTQGHSYRKPGAMVLVNDAGEQFGLLSGGCLEADIRLNAKKCMTTGRSILKTYDGSDDEDLAFHLGCGGIVDILIQPLTPDNNYLKLEELHSILQQGKRGYYFLQVPENNELSSAFFEATQSIDHHAKAALVDRNQLGWLKIPVRPEPHLLIAGGGIDAGPVVNLAKQMGWTVSLWDSRPAYGRPEHFPSVDNNFDDPVERLDEWAQNHQVDVAVLMTHNMKMDAECLKALNHTNLKLVGLLGPTSRKQQVLDLAELKEQDLKIPLRGPVGLDIGGELPESLALSILSQFHEVLFKPQ